MAGDMTVGDFFAFTLYLGFMVAPIIQMSNIGSQITEAFAGLDRTEELLSFLRRDENKQRVVSLPRIDGTIIFEMYLLPMKKETK